MSVDTCRWTRVEMRLRLEPLNGRLTWIRAHKLEPCNEQIHEWDDNDERDIRIVEGGNGNEME